MKKSSSFHDSLCICLLAVFMIQGLRVLSCSFWLSLVLRKLNRSLRVVHALNLLEISQETPNLIGLYMPKERTTSLKFEVNKKSKKFIPL